MSALGFLESGAQIGLQLLVIKPKRGMSLADGTSAIVAQAVLEEVHQDELEVTEHPVEQGTVISDHAFVRPAELILTYGFSNSPNQTSAVGALAGFAAAQNGAARTLVAAAEAVSGVAAALTSLSGGLSVVQQAYNNLLTLYRARTLFTIYTGKRTYKNMLIKSLSTTTDKEAENSLIVRIGCKQILMAQTQTVTVPDSSVMADPGKNAAVSDMGTTYPVPTPNINVSALP
jgi:hypothetical protein